MLQSYRLVNRHLCNITVICEEYKGTTFHLRLPTDHKIYIHHKDTVSNESVPYFIPEPTDNISYNQSPETAPSLLIVEDNPDLRNFLRQSLAESYRITEAQNGQEALETIAQEQPDLIISDIMMPVMRGDDLCQTLKDNMETSHIPIILITALETGKESSTDSMLKRTVMW